MAIGYNYLFQPNLLLGVEADINSGTKSSEVYTEVLGSNQDHVTQTEIGHDFKS